MSEHETQVHRWPEAEPVPDEPGLRRLMTKEGLAPYRWSNGPGDVYGAHTHPYHKVIYVVDGSIAFGVADGQLELRPGDRLDLPAGTRHDARVGPQGVVCLEGHRKA
jgi:quercetin dioxygenase-like cupin family protein